MRATKLEIQMLTDRVTVHPTNDNGERRGSAGIVMPATAELANRPVDRYEVEVQGESNLVMRERDLHAVASERAEHYLYLA